ncbi:uncharacterized protein KY384_005597 [Bacidia gigantensis]|uniref:uncharacterized protein n=1 Tax=Bacidia gigantensis TaxID=2732470 RepID=UPI001D0455C4|nr:uncharacterized protein KY384_005597 [Bacidia gigantensis]KAG8530115.1 hypothetical protein KY384_005597 [Bacidia gigantensis]
MSENSNTGDASMLRGHANYVAGAAKEAIGSYTSTDMQNAGASDKQAAVDEMRAAKSQSDAQGGELNKNSTLGSVEQKLGSATGCEGMEDEGAKRQT